jgi:hypothetical protein
MLTTVKSWKERRAWGERERREEEGFDGKGKDVRKRVSTGKVKKLGKGFWGERKDTRKRVLGGKERHEEEGFGVRNSYLVHRLVAPK